MPESNLDTANAESAAPGIDGEALSVDLGAQLQFLEEERAKLEAEKQDLLRIAQTRTAEFENFKRRVERERVETIDFALGETIKSLLPIVDDFERATQVQTTDGVYAKGVELIHIRLREALAKLGLEALETQGKAFDPNVHHGIEMVETEETEDQTVIGEFQKGYLFRGKLLRPAMVRVAVKK
jgi:molecular chaperone GrpE